MNRFSSSSRTYILVGREPIECTDLKTWAKWFKKHNRVLSRTELGNVRISTVFLGVDHAWPPGTGPVLFETMVFGGSLDGEMDRYKTWDQAALGHQDMVARVKQTLPLRVVK